MQKRKPNKTNQTRQPPRPRRSPADIKHIPRDSPRPDQIDLLVPWFFDVQELIEELDLGFSFPVDVRDEPGFRYEWQWSWGRIRMHDE